MPAKSAYAIYAEHKATSLLADYASRFGLIDGPPIPFDLIAEKHLGLKIVVLDIERELGIEALAATISERKLILIDRECVDSPRYSFTLCHEIGHYELHRDQRTPARLQQQVFCGKKTRMWKLRERLTQLEREADRFAASLLMPRVLIDRAFERVFEYRADRSVDVVVPQLARQFEVSRAAMTLRLRECGLVGARSASGTRVDDFVNTAV